MKRVFKSRIEIKALGDLINKFFESRAFTVKSEVKEGSVHYAAVPRQGVHNIIEPIYVTLKRISADELEVTFEAGKKSHSLTLLGWLTHYFGGGIFARLGIHSEEEIESLEREFWLLISSFIYSQKC